MNAEASRGPKVGDLTETIEVVKLVSTDEKVYFMNRDVACQSKLLASQVTTAERLASTQTRVIHLDLPAHTLETVIKYLHYRIINARLEKEERAKFELSPNEALNILNAAIYLQC